MYQGDIHNTDRVIVEFPDCMSTDITTMAGAVKMLHDAQGVSTYIKVKMTHPDWEEGEVQEEVNRIMQEFGVADPTAIAQAGDLHTPPDQGGKEGDA